MDTQKNDAIERIKKEITELQDTLDILIGEEEAPIIETLGEVKNRVDSKPKLPKYETGVRWFDEKMNGGLTLGTFINIASESFAGKTTFATEIMLNISEYRKVLFFSFEMYENILIDRIKNATSSQQGNMLISQQNSEINAIERAINAYIDEGVRFIVIDSRMKINVNGINDEYQKNTEISKRLSKLCQQLGVVILLINQISESDLKNKRLSLKGSGDQFYDSDVVLFITVNHETDERTMYCTKDRINSRKWKQVMPDYKKSEFVETKYEMPIVA